MAISNPTYDPINTATSLATEYTKGQKSILDAQAAAATATTTGLSKLSSAMSAFQSALASLASGSKTVSANAATFSNSAIGTASATSSAVAGTYSFYVEQLATAGQVAYGGLTDTVAAGSGNLNVMLADGSSFQIGLAAADKNVDGVLSAKEIAAAINIAAANNSRVTASTLNVNGTSTLVLTSNLTGADNAVSLDTSGVSNAALKTALDDPLNQNQVVSAKDAIVWIGAQGTGTKVQQASNVYAVVDDVTMTFTKAQTVGDTPVTLTVAPDAAATAANVQTFVDAYNKLSSLLAELNAAGDASKSVKAGVFAADAGVSALRAGMISAVRTVAGGQSLVNYGITAQRDGTLALDTTRMKKAIAANPSGLDTLFGKTALGAGTGVLGKMDKLMSSWTNSATGQLGARKASVSKQQVSITDRQAILQNQYDNAYKRYLGQFTALQTLQSQMGSTTNLLTALFSSSKDS